MSNDLKVKPSDLAKVWSIARSTEQKQVTLRVPAETFYKIQALESMFPGRSRNELVADLLSTALDEFEESLPVSSCESDRIVDYEPNGEPIYASYDVGPRAQFLDFFRQAESAANRASAKPELKSVETGEGVEDAA